MSGKQAKQRRREAQDLQDLKVVRTVMIQVLDNGAVAVEGFPVHLGRAMAIISAGAEAVARHFVSQANQGNVTDAMTISQSSIVQPKNGIVVPH